MPKRKQPITIRSPEKDEVFIFRSVTRNGLQRVRKVISSSFELAKEKAILAYSDIIYFKPKTMDLMTARDRAAKASKTTKRPHYVIYDGDGDGECSVNTAPLRGSAHKFVLGVEDKSYKPKAIDEEQERPKHKSLPAGSAKAQKLINAKTAKESAEDDSENEETIKTEKQMTKDIKKAVKAGKVAGKNPAPKKAVKKSTGKKASGPADWGKKVTMTNKEMTAKIKKGFVYRNSTGQNKTKYIPERPNQELVNEDYFESKPE
jgi:hypothetical protein